MEVPFFRPTIDENDRNNIRHVLDSCWLTTGNWSHQFENDFSNFIGVKHCIAVNSATAALHLSIIASGIKPGEGVLVPTMTFASTAEILYYQNIKPILVDCNLDDLSISEEDAIFKIKQAVNNNIKVRGIIPVHYAGKMVQMDWVEAFAQKYSLQLIEDAAHCCNSAYYSKTHKKWLKKAPLSLTQCYSFYCNKCITTCGEGGMVATDDDNTAETIRKLSLHGLSSNAWSRFGKNGNVFYDISFPGFKYNLTDVAAAMGCSQLQKANLMNEKRKNAVKLYKSLLKENPYITFLNDDESNFIHSYHLFVIRISSKAPVTRDKILTSLKEQGIIPSVHWKPLHLHSFYQKQGFVAKDFPNANQAFNEIISLPLFPSITKEQIYYVSHTLNNILTC